MDDIIPVNLIPYNNNFKNSELP